MRKIKQVEQFHKVFGEPVKEQPDITETALFKKRVRFMFEELLELTRALPESDKLDILKEAMTEVHGEMSRTDRANEGQVAALDALCDLEYFLKGTILAFGFQHVFDRAFNEVHESNMSKACATFQDIDDTSTYYDAENVETFSEVHSAQDPFYAVVRRASDGKILKSVNAVKPNLQQFL